MDLTTPIASTRVHMLYMVIFLLSQSNYFSPCDVKFVVVAVILIVLLFYTKKTRATYSGAILAELETWLRGYQ